jgi:hypothetical protein
MKIPSDRFAIPNCILEDDLPDSALRVLLFLFRRSNISGRVSAGYLTVMEGARITSRNTVARALKVINENGWFDAVKKTGQRDTVYFLRIPPRFAQPLNPRGSPPTWLPQKKRKAPKKLNGHPSPAL